MITAQQARALVAEAKQRRLAKATATVSNITDVPPVECSESFRKTFDGVCTMIARNYKTFSVIDVFKATRGVADNFDFSTCKGLFLQWANNAQRNGLIEKIPSIDLDVDLYAIPQPKPQQK